MKLWQAQQILCRYDPEAELHIKLPDGRVVVVDHLEDHYVRDESGHGVGPRCPTFATGVELEDSWDTLRGNSPSGPDLTEYQYETTSRQCSAIGVDKAKIPEPPEGEGWELVTAALGGNTFWYFWRRPVGVGT